MTAMPAPKHSLVPLESGDRLTRAEFHRRYCARPDIKKAELIKGVVYVAPPVSGRHGEPYITMGAWARFYTMSTPGIHVTGDTTLILAGANEIQPDLMVFRDPAPPGGAYFRDDFYVEGPPQLIVEIAVSSRAYDLREKFSVYQEAGVAEYIVWRVPDGQIDWFRLEHGRYVRVEPDERGVIESAAFPGLRLSVRAMLANDLAAVLAEMQRG
jgi:Uma2 family endonuclease